MKLCDSESVVKFERCAWGNLKYAETLIVMIVMVERSSDWVDQAEGDLEHAKNDLNSGFYEWACFSAQQSAGKAVKAVFQKLGLKLGVTPYTTFWKS